MNHRMIRRVVPALLLTALVVTVPVRAAEREVDVLVVRLAGGSGEERFRYMDLPAAARFLSPVAFTARGGGLSFETESSSGMLERGRRALASRPSGTLEQVSLLLTTTGREPRPSRTVTVSFTLDELLVRGGPWSGVPAVWACARAAAETRWTSGRVWARSAVYDGSTGRITVKVALSK